MKLSKLLLAVVGATVLLGAFVSTASARNLSLSSQTKTILWRTMSFTGSPIGTAECEVRLSGSFHTRTNTKTVGSLIGYMTEGVVLRCARGSATVNRGSLPWHLRYRGFIGTLPRIAGQSATVTGAEFTIREPLFGITCTARRETSSLIFTYTIEAGGAITRADISGSCDCSGVNTTISGSETNVTNGAGARITLTLI